MEMLDYQAVSKLTGLAVQSLRQYKADGKMPPPDAIIGNRSPVWKRKTIEKWMRDAQKPRGWSGGNFD
jgi:predicted DNA-binding transcriptional regulator AlpA